MLTSNVKTRNGPGCAWFPGQEVAHWVREYPALRRATALGASVMHCILHLPGDPDIAKPHTYVSSDYLPARPLTKRALFSEKKMCCYFLARGRPVAPTQANSSSNEMQFPYQLARDSIHANHGDIYGISGQ